MKTKGLALSLVILTLAFLLFSSNGAGLRSDLALQVQGYGFKDKSVFNQVGLEFFIPTGKGYSKSGWTNNVKLYHPGNNFPHDQGNGNMSILYNFGHFEEGRSTFYDPNSEYFNAHYGVYAIHLNDSIFGWKNGALDEAAVTKIIAFDQLELVMASLGCPASRRHFDYQITDVKEGHAMAGFSDWILINAVINTNSPLHHKTQNRLGYVQYGEPLKNYQGEDFPIVEMQGRIYLRYDEVHKVTVIYFVIGKTLEFIEKTSNDYLIPIEWNDVN
ncbi:hypothetical protein [Acetobacterium bakii]|uniref:Uncharacterized protein n=1 Tax=Acetobacterium bakii TaxID=52689 RepID=A0A0L6U090_9FIRM|nr:hypothetical protein [Acetobacterium bakii]KNZ41903.1 hypothetical protein AKG39_09830 [Acetobacterium bakii]